ncbi:hypothetical protein ACLK17_13485 [Escherichia coli]
MASRRAIWTAFCRPVPAALITALNQQGYQLGSFSSDGFTSPLYRRYIVVDF